MITDWLVITGPQESSMLTGNTSPQLHQPWLHKRHHHIPNQAVPVNVELK